MGQTGLGEGDRQGDVPPLFVRIKSVVQFSMQNAVIYFPRVLLYTHNGPSSPVPTFHTFHYIS